MNFTKSQSGYTLLFAVLTAALVLGIGAFILGLARKQFIISSTSRDSIYAFYAADTGIQCATQADSANWSVYKGQNPDYSVTFGCANNDGVARYNLTAEPKITLTFPHTEETDTSLAPAELKGFGSIYKSNTVNFLLRDITSSDYVDNVTGCVRLLAWLGTDDKGVSRTVVESRGYNLCNTDGTPKASIRTVERAITAIQ
jgi:hypothetical protein